MEVRELRICNFVSECTFTENPFWCHRVESISFEYVNEKLQWKIGLDNGDIWNIEQLYPISLTEEWLLKFGFEINMDNFNWNAGIGDWKDDFELALRYTEDSGWFYRSIKTPIKYVHQLQNLYYSIMGKELKLK